MRIQMRSAFLAAGLAIAACAKPAPPAPEFMAADEAAVRARVDSAAMYIKAADWAKWAEGFSNNAIFQPPNGKAIQGRSNIQAFGVAFPPLESFGFSDVRIAGEGNLAYVTTAIHMKIKGAPADTSKQLAVFKKSPAGKWEVVAVSFSSDLAVAMAPAPPGRGTKSK